MEAGEGTRACCTRGEGQGHQHHWSLPVPQFCRMSGREAPWAMAGTSHTLPAAAERKRVRAE